MVLNQDHFSEAQYGALANPRHTASAGLSRKACRGIFFANCPDLGSFSGVKFLLSNRINSLDVYQSTNNLATHSQIFSLGIRREKRLPRPTKPVPVP
jgi:hypothetical protein